MQPQILVISNPPHPDPNPEAVAAILGLELANAQLKIGFAAPEILSATDPDRAREVASELRGAGMSVAVIDGYAMTRIPWPQLVTSFEFGSQGLIVRFGEDVMELRYDDPVSGILCTPPPDFDAGTSGNGETPHPIRSGDFEATEAIEWKARLDLYVTHHDAIRRISIVSGVTDFSGLPVDSAAGGSDELDRTAAECGLRFSHFDLDRRLVDVRPRQRFVAGETGFDMDMRKAFSFGTLLLRHVLESISPELRDIPQYEYGSRVAYLVNQEGGAA